MDSRPNCIKSSKAAKMISRNNFSLTDVIGSLEIQTDSNPFKKLKFENPEIQKTYKPENSEVVSEFSFSSEEPKEKEVSKISSLNSFEKNAKKESKLTPKIKRSDKHSTIYTLSSDSSKHSDDILEAERPNSTKFTNMIDDKENVPSRSKEYLEFLPGKKYCKSCKSEVNTTVKLEMPTVPLWKRLCCSNCEIDSYEKFQRILHMCVNCKKVIHVATPSFF